MDIYFLETCGLRFSDVEHYLPKVTESRRRSVLRKRDESAKVESLMAEVLVLWGIRQRTGLSPREVEFSRGAHGKPYITGSDLYFSLSHTKGAVCAAFSGEEVGVDIERRDRQVSEAVKTRVLSDRELFVCSDGEDFIKAWVRKEAFLKRLGVGITRDLRNVDTLMLPDTAGYSHGDYIIGASGSGAESAKILSRGISREI